MAPEGQRVQRRPGTVVPYLIDTVLARERALLLGQWGEREPGWGPGPALLHAGSTEVRVPSFLSHGEELLPGITQSVCVCVC